MMKTRNLIILAAVLLILVGINFMQKSQHQKETSGSATVLVVEGEFDKNNISRLSLGFGPDEDAVVLTAGPDGWIIESYHNARANEQRISTLLRNFSNLAGEFRSDSEKVLGDYGLLDDQAVRVRGLDKSGNPVLDLVLGRTSKGFPGQFMRSPGSNKVYLSQSGLLSHLGIFGDPEKPQAKHFLELQAVKEDQKDIDLLKVQDGDVTFEFSKEFGVIEPAEDSPEGTQPTIDRSTWEWMLNGKTATDLAKTKVDGVLNSSVSIRATDVADPTVSAAEYGLDSPSRMVTLTRQDGSDLLLEFGNSREADENISAGTYLRVSGNPAIWVVTDYTIKNIFKSRDDLKAE